MEPYILSYMKPYIISYIGPYIKPVNLSNLSNIDLLTSFLLFEHVNQLIIRKPRIQYNASLPTCPSEPVRILTLKLPKLNHFFSSSL